MVGIDIIEVVRVDQSQDFVQRIASESEIEYINKSKSQKLRHQRIAALFCVKEAVMKALDMGAGSGVVFKDIILSHTDTGKPIIALQGKALEKYNEYFKEKTIEVSISHTENYATAIALIT
ncbi:MAG: holo-[acyl-carrier-protein] synthase [Clostridiales bacterium]|nr:holo-[acyl-carrier-protein] synthase [Clostridiales bacterium]